MKYKMFPLKSLNNVYIFYKNIEKLIILEEVLTT